VIAALKEEDPAFEAEVEFPIGVHGINTPRDSEVVQVVEAAVRDIGLEPEIGGSSGGFDARWISDALGIPFVSYGAGWNGPDGKLCLHAPNEAITIENLIGMTKGFAMIMLRACGVAE
jgi:acetylornithine deacetylase/succinyl-diaminopimelate desuccinylase-like protein